MFSANHWIKKHLLFLLVITFFCSLASLQAQGLKPPSTIPGVVPLLEQNYSGLQQFFVDSTLFRIKFTRFRREAYLDSTHHSIIFEEKLFDRYYRLPIKVDLAYYVKERLAFDDLKYWHESVKRQHQFRREQGGGIQLNIPVKIKSKTFKRIFGGDRVGLRVSGNISFELAGRTESREGSAISSFDQRNNFSPKFKQTQQFRVEGRVGDKVTVSVDQNSEATFDFENTLKLTYDGDEDEIVQKIEAGNVALSLPSTNFVSTSSNHQGLFGIKTEMQVGKFKFTGVASLERGENESITISGSSRENSFRIKDIDFIDNRFFFVDDYYQKNFESDLNTDQMILALDSRKFIRQLDVWKTVITTGTSNRDETKDGIAGIDPRKLATTSEDTSGRVESGLFKRLEEGKDYFFNYQRGYFWLSSQAQSNEIIAVSYLTDEDTVGTLFQQISPDTTVRDTVLLRLIKPKGQNKPEFPVWELTMRNVYNLGASGIKADGFDANVIYSVTGEDQEVDQSTAKTYNFLMGLDRLNEQDDVVDGGDKKIDISQQFIFDLADGYLIFPSLHPFNPGEVNGKSFPGAWPDDRRVDIYQTTNPTEKQRESKFAIEVKTTAVSSSFDLGFNVLEGSEKVRLNGRELIKEKDYTIDYFSGQLEITAPEARRSDAQVEIEFERGALFQLDKKTLLGGRLEYAFGEKNFIGLTTLYHSRSTLDQRVRLGQEPIRNLIWDVNTALHFKPNFLTTLFDKLPIVETSAESKLNIEAEYAQVNPNPNTFNETQIGDNDGVAYIDDFEGSKRFTSLGIQFRTWTPASVPMRFGLISNPIIDYSVKDFPTQKQYILEMDKKRVQFNWFNPFEQVPIKQIFPDRDVTAQSGTTTNIMNLRWQNSTVSEDSAWAGIMRSTLSFTDQQKTKFIELWVRGEKGQVNVDIGRISEDYYVRGEFPDYNNPSLLVESYANLNTEDRNFNGLLDLDAVDFEDIGIDGVAGVDGSNVAGDAGDDDWADPFVTIPDFLRINGTEGNANQQGARFPDTEDLDGDGAVNTFNDYIEYSFNLDTTIDKRYFAGRTEFDNGTPTGWKLYRIPLRDPLRTIFGNPDTSFQQVFNVRLWVNDLPKTSPTDFDTLQIATFDFVGNEWEEIGFSDSLNGNLKLKEEKFGITVYNTDEHGGFPIEYESPPDVSGIRDRITQAVSKEQSLVMQLFEFEPGARAEARKQLRERINLINYSRLKMFVHGDRDLHPEMGDSLIFFIRFGPTQNIYYEYRELVYPDWDEKNEIEIDFEELAKTKDFPIDPAFARDSIPGVPIPDSLVQVFYRRDPTAPQKQFIVVGKPGLHNINFFTIGAMNVGDTDLSGNEIWIDEMRVTGVERESGTAIRLKTDLTLADIGRFSAQWELVDDNFRRLEQQFASPNGKDQTREKQSYFGSLQLHKFLPESWGFQIPIDAKYTRSRSVPKYFFNSDKRTNYQVAGAENRLKTFFGLSTIPDSLAEEISVTETKSIGGTFKRKDKQRDPWYLHYTLNQLVVDMDYSNKHASSPTEKFNDQQSFSSRLSYQIPFGKNNFFRPFGWLGKGKFLQFLTGQKIYYTPTSTSFNFTLTDNKSQRQNRLEATPPDANINVKTTRKISIGYKLTDAISVDFNRDYQNDPRLERTPATLDTNVAFISNDNRARDVVSNILNQLKFGEDRRITQRFNVTYNPRIFNWLNSNYRYNSNFIYSLDRPQINARGTNLNTSHNIGLDFKMGSLMESIWKPKVKRGGATNRNRARRNRNAGKDKDAENSDKKPQDENEKDDGSGFSVPNPAKMIWHVFHSFKSFSFNYKKDQAFALGNIADVPSLNFQFGFTQNPSVALDSSFNKVVTLPNVRKTENMDGSFQLDIARNITASLKYNKQKVDNFNNEQRTESVSNTVFFTGDDPGASPDSTPDWWSFVPDWRVSIRGAEKLPLLKAIAKTATIEHNRTGKFTESSRFQGDEKNRNQWSYTINYSPLLGITLNTIWNVNGTIRATKSRTFDYRTAGAVTKREQSGFNISMSYAITRGFRIPLLMKKKLNNEIQFSLSFDRTNNQNFSKSINEAKFQELDISKNWKLRPSVSYRFSQKVNGTAFYEQSTSENKRTGKTSFKEFGINVNIAIR